MTSRRIRTSTACEMGRLLPVIAWWPGRIPAGATSAAFVTALDLFPTLASIVGGAIPADRPNDGADVSSAWFGAASPASPRATLFAVYGRGESIRVGPWKLHRHVLGTRNATAGKVAF